jgi:hypothetical protein
MQIENEDSSDVLDNQDIPEYSSEGNDSVSHTESAQEVEEQARMLGWVSEDEYKGDPQRWADASSFLELHSRNNSVLRKALAKQSKDLEELKNQMRGMDSAHRQIFEIQIKKQKEEHEQQISFLKAQKREALRSGEHETAADIDEQLDTLRERGPNLPEAPAPKQAHDPNEWKKNPTMVAWAERNPWFDKDEDMSLYAGGIGQKIRVDNPNMPFSELLEEVTVRVRKAFPAKFAGGRRSPVEGTTTGETRAATSGRTYESLPRDAKAACDEALSDNPGLTKKQWVELYYGYDDRRKR